MPDYLVSFAVPELRSFGHITINMDIPMEPDHVPLIVNEIQEQVHIDNPDLIIIPSDIAILNVHPLYPNTRTPVTIRTHRHKE